MKTISRHLSVAELKDRLLQEHKIIDVRAPVEYAQGALPNSINLPILNDEERALIGTCYKKSGREKAIELGYQIVSGTNKIEKVRKWQEFIKQNPHVLITCFRGGLRSQIAQTFLYETGLDIPRIEEGYKAARQYFSEELQSYLQSHCNLHNETGEPGNFRVITGNTGSGKTKILKCAQAFYPAVDLEDLAMHKGSAFGAMNRPQPAQASFENNLSFEIMKLRLNNSKTAILFEDESRLIGRVHLPEKFFDKLRNSRVIKVNIDLEARVENIFSDYIYPEEQIFDKYAAAVSKIEKKLGGQRADELKNDLACSKKQFLEQGLLVSNKIWIEKLLVWYYDPMYSYSFNNRNPQIEFAGTPQEIIDYLKHKAP